MLNWLILLVKGGQDSTTFIQRTEKSVEKGFSADFQRVFGFSFTEAKQWLVKSGTNLIFAILILLIGFWLAKWVGRVVVKILNRGKVDKGLVTFLSSLSVITLKVLVIVTAITQLGIEMTSFVAILGAAGLAIGMAFSGTLSNFAGGVMILLFKPFKVGDTIQAQTQQGKVTEIQIFYTYLYTNDNKVAVLPNGPLANGNLVNFTREKKRRAEWMFTLVKQEDYVRAYEEIKQLLQQDKRILKKPESIIAINSIEKGYPQVVVRAWVATEDLTHVTFAINEQIITRFTALNIDLKQE